MHRFHRDLESLLQAYNLACRVRRQRVLDGHFHEQEVKEWLKVKPFLANKAFRSAAPCDLTGVKVAAQVTF